MFTSNFSKHFKLNYHLQLVMFYTARVEKNEFRNETEEKIVRESLQHHETEVCKLTPRVDESTENILTRKESITFNPIYQRV